MLQQELDLTRSIARKMAREILPEELDAIAAGTISLDQPCGCPGDIDQGGIA